MEKLNVGHKDVFQIISHIQPFDELEKKDQAETLAWINSGVPIFRIKKPDIPNKHLVAYFVLWDKESEKILLVDHKQAGLWLPTGGHVEIDEHPRETVLRECMEELNYQAEFYVDHPIFLTSTLTVGMTAGHTDVSLWYILKGDHQNEYAFDKREFKDIRWFALNEIPYHLSDPHMRRFVQKLQIIKGD